MKYIRALSKIYDTSKLILCVNSRNQTYYRDENSMVYLPKREADTIEELCDEFVLHYGDTIQRSVPIPWATYERRDDNWQKHKEKLISELKKTERKAIVYGAIWTDKGLVYVAKMNDKGELELL